MATLDHPLDDTRRLEEIDSSDMLGVVSRFPSQFREALEISDGVRELPSIEGISSVVSLGMGGSGISGDVVASLSSDTLSVPFTTNKGYSLPAFVGKDTLVFAVSYSGNTEETLETTEEALARGARVVAVTSGGKLGELARGNGLPVFQIPGGQQPRASLGYLMVPIMCALEKIGLAKGLVEQIGPAAKMLDDRAAEYSVEVHLEENATKRLAQDLIRQLPVVYGSEGPVAVAAKRWKTQFNENSKIPAFDNYFPELNHNETVGWLHLEEICSECHLVLLREDGEHDRVEKRIAITAELIRDNVAHITSIWARGDTPLEKLLDLIYFGDFTSVYLALAMGVDPTPVTRIEELKKSLAEGD